MKNEKGKVTRIINQVKSKFPEDNNVFGYEGISREKILISLDQTYTYLGLLDDHEDEIEAIWVKRKFAKYYDDAAGILEKMGSDKWAVLFNDFLEIVTLMRSSAKDLYVTLTDKPLRIDEEIQKAKEQLEVLLESCDGIDEKMSIVNEGKDTVEEVAKRMSEIEKRLNEKTEKTQILIDTLEENTELIEKAQNEIGEVIPQIAQFREETKQLIDEQKISKNSVSDVLSKVNEGLVKTEEMKTKLEKQIDIDDDIQKKIIETLSDVNRHGMAGAFLKRKMELRTTALLWGISSILSMATLVIVSYLLASDMIVNPNFDPLKNLYKVPSIIAGVWLCWFCAKQFGYTIRIREDYSYKYAISMAFEGYKNETREVNQEMLEKLLQLTILSVSMNPVSLYDTKSNHGSPWQETMDGVRKVFKADLKADLKADMNKIIP